MSIKVGYFKIAEKNLKEQFIKHFVLYKSFFIQDLEEFPDERLYEFNLIKNFSSGEDIFSLIPADVDLIISDFFGYYAEFHGDQWCENTGSWLSQWRHFEAYKTIEKFSNAEMKMLWQYLLYGRSFSEIEKFSTLREGEMPIGWWTKSEREFLKTNLELLIESRKGSSEGRFIFKDVYDILNDLKDYYNDLIIVIA